MSTQDSGEGLADVFVKGAVFTLGAAAAGLVLRRVFRSEPEVVVVAVTEDDLGESDDFGGARPLEHAGARSGEPTR